MPRSILHVLRPLLFLLCVALVALVAAGCGNDLAQDPILALSSEEALDEGKRLLETEKFSRARRYLDHAFEAGPNSASGREALLRGADAHYLQGGRTNYIQCEAKYRDFLNRFPTSQRADYAQFQIANCLFQRMERPDRDQQITRQALAAYEELIQLYPTSGHVPEAEQRMVEVFNNLAESEYMVGSFYVRRGLCGAAIKRLAPLEAQHPNFPDKAKLRYQLGVAYRNCR
ncbi:MAG: outer membrane protein assembly factor BamD, partial [Acidobacteriota bacterium]